MLSATEGLTSFALEVRVSGSKAVALCRISCRRPELSRALLSEQMRSPDPKLGGSPALPFRRRPRSLGLLHGLCSVLCSGRAAALSVPTLVDAIGLVQLEPAALIAMAGVFQYFI